MHQLLMLNVTELEVTGDVLVNSISDCPPIAPGEGSVVTARFVTRQVDVIARVSVLGANGEIETIQGTTIHPIWSVDRQDWVELSELQPGESLQGAAGIATVLRVDIEQRSLPVYNIEVHTQHVYQIGNLALLVHNANPGRCTMIAEYGEDFMKGYEAAHIVPQRGWKWAPKELSTIIERVEKAGLMHDMANLFASKPRHAGTHKKKYVKDLIRIMLDKKTKAQIKSGLNDLWKKIESGSY